ncbi:MAG: DAK2 domain-containing protein [Actinomycetota bacterium]|nr:DAK2 domain-containing protein [Actinomycetota bacterium]
MELFREALEIHREELNSLNVFPVPDGDTGTNMLLTQRAVTYALERSSAKSDLKTVANVVSAASLMGARGNSGVILSQVLRAFCEACGTRTEVEGQQLAAALDTATEQAYRAVSKPVEGTMLSVLRDATAAARTADHEDDCGAVLTASLVASRESLERTREIHPDLRRAGVVDAGGKGIVLLFDALRSAVTGEPTTVRVGSLGPVRTHERGAPSPGSNLEYEVQYLLEARPDDMPALRGALTSLGESVVVIGGGGLFNIHVHTDEPDSVVQAGKRTGNVREVSVVPLADQVGECLAGEARSVRVAEETSLVAVAEETGVRRALESFGAVVVGSETGVPPPMDDLVAVVNSVPSETVIVLSTGADMQAQAERVATDSSKRALVVPAPSIPAGLSAAAAFNPVLDIDENVRSMKEVLAESRSGAIMRRELSEQAEGRSGGWIGVADEEVVYDGPSIEEAATAVVRRLLEPGAELLTLIVGSGSDPRAKDGVLAAIERLYSNLRIDVISGGQPRDAFLIGVE